jgi:Zn-dependent M28 family amino/carboxypeptidase
MFMSRPRYALDLEGSNTVMILTRQTDVTSLTVEMDYALTTAELTNVVGVIPGRRSDEVVLFSAHHDHVGIGRPVDGDSIYNGANDDASGATAVIALARYFKQLRQPERTLVFATFTAEERGGFGSQYLSRQMDPDQTVAMFNIEMIGKPGVENPNLIWITGFDETDFGEILEQGQVADSGYTFGADPYPDQNLFYRSDNAVFARLGVPAHSISTTSMDSDEDYHQASDEIETLDIDHMTMTVKAIALGAMPIVSGEATPTRVDPSGLN